MLRLREGADVKAALAHTVSEAAELLRVSPGLLYRMIRRGGLKAVRLGRAVRIPRPELERLCGIGHAIDEAARLRMVRH